MSTQKRPPVKSFRAFEIEVSPNNQIPTLKELSPGKIFSEKVEAENWIRDNATEGKECTILSIYLNK